MHEKTRELYKEIAKAIGVADLAPDDEGLAQITVGADITVLLFPESDVSLTIIAPAIPLPKNVDYVSTLWLLQQNHYDSPIAPFRIACNDAGMLIIWGRVPTENVSGVDIAGMIDAVVEEVGKVREELAEPEPTAPRG